METRPVTPLEGALYALPFPSASRVALFSVGPAEEWSEALHGTLLYVPEEDAATLSLRTDVGTDYAFLRGTGADVAALPEAPRPADLAAWTDAVA